MGVDMVTTEIYYEAIHAFEYHTWTKCLSDNIENIFDITPKNYGSPL